MNVDDTRLAETFGLESVRGAAAAGIQPAATSGAPGLDAATAGSELSRAAGANVSELRRAAAVAGSEAKTAAADGPGRTTAAVWVGAINDMKYNSNIHLLGESSFDRNIHKALVRKVFFLVLAQFAVTTVSVCIFLFCKPVRKWTHTTASAFWVLVSVQIVYLVIVFVIILTKGIRRCVPINFVSLSIATACFAILTGIITSIFGPYRVLIALGATVLVCLLIALLSLQTKVDFTKHIRILSAVSLILFLLGLAFIICGPFLSSESRFILQCVYTGVVALPFVAITVCDIQFILNGKYGSNYPEEYIILSMTIYMDIISIFLISLPIIFVVLRIFPCCDKEKKIDPKIYVEHK